MPFDNPQTLNPKTRTPKMLNDPKQFFLNRGVYHTKHYNVLYDIVCYKPKSTTPARLNPKALLDTPKSPG